jgi:hypothetical protein
VKDERQDDTAISVSLETLARHIAETPRGEIAALRAAFDRQISSVEARLDARSHQSAIDAAVKMITGIIGERIDRAQQRSEATVTQALGANILLRKALDNAQEQLASTQAALAAAESDRKDIAAQHREALSEKKRLAAALKHSQEETEELTVERVELQRMLKDATAAKAAAETQYQQLVLASQKLTDGLSLTLHGKRDQPRPVAEAPPKRSEFADDKIAAKVAQFNSTSSKVTAPAAPPAPSAAAPRKKPLQFSEQARDAKRVRIRRGTHVSVDGIPGELVDMSIGGAQAVLRQIVKPNQLVRMVLPTAAGQLICKGRIVWVLYEQPNTSLSVFRTGMKFTDIDAGAVEDFMKDFREEPLAPSRTSSETA